MVASCAEDLASFLGGEGRFVDEGVAKSGQLRLRDRGDDLAHADVKVAAPLLPKLLGDRVRAEQSRDELHGLYRRETADDAQHFGLLVGAQAVAALHLRGGYPLSEQGGKSARCQLDQLVLRGGARRADRAMDAAAGPGDVEIRRPAAAKLEFGASLAGEYQVGVRIDEAWSDESPVRVDHLR